MIQNSKSTNLKKATHVGEYVSKSYCEDLQSSYSNHFPHSTSSFVIPKALIQKVLTDYPSSVGIRFMYGLIDELNPNAVRIILVPCSTDSLTSVDTNPIIAMDGYYDHEGEHYSLLEVTQLLANFVQNMSSRDTSWAYKEITRGGFFGCDSILDLIKDEECQYIQFSFGLKSKVIQAILEPLDSDMQAYTDVSNPCPPNCPVGDNPCMATKAVEFFSAEAELNEYRHFRDEVLLHYPQGGRLYEMYYFISPLITSVLSGKSNQVEAFREIYESKIIPFKTLVNENKQEEAVAFLDEAFSELAEEYQLEVAV